MEDQSKLMIIEHIKPKKKKTKQIELQKETKKVYKKSHNQSLVLYMFTNLKIV